MNTKDINILIESAKKARLNAYTPYSKFKVGAAILLKNGKIVTGANIENVSFGLTNCAERTAIFKLISEGYDPKEVIGFAIIGQTKEPISPCGACRQVMAEFFSKDLEVVLANLDGKYLVTTLKDLLPYSFEEIEDER